MTEQPDYRERIKHDVGKAEKYTRRKGHKHKAEMDLIERGMALTEKVRTVLDAPCGVGRATIWFAQQGYEATGIDLGEGAVEVARRNAEEAGVSPRIEIADINEVPFGERAFDAVLCFRLLHHFPTADIRGPFMDAIASTADKYVLISYLSPWSPTSIRRRVKRALFGKPIIQNPTALAEIRERFQSNGFEMVKDMGRSGIGHSLRLAVFRRRDA